MPDEISFIYHQQSITFSEKLTVLKINNYFDFPTVNLPAFQEKKFLCSITGSHSTGKYLYLSMYL
jgi:hypothetical protein